MPRADGEVVAITASAAAPATISWTSRQHSARYAPGWGDPGLRGYLLSIEGGIIKSSSTTAEATRPEQIMVSDGARDQCAGRFGVEPPGNVDR